MGITMYLMISRE